MGKEPAGATERVANVSRKISLKSKKKRKVKKPEKSKMPYSFNTT